MAPGTSASTRQRSRRRRPVRSSPPRRPTRTATRPSSRRSQPSSSSTRRPRPAPGANSVTLNLTSTSGLPVSYTVVGPATFDPSTHVLTVTGLGTVTVTVTAHQAGDVNYNPAPDISATYSVAPASLCGVFFKDFN